MFRVGSAVKLGAREKLRTAQQQREEKRKGKGKERHTLFCFEGEGWKQEM